MADGELLDEQADGPPAIARPRLRFQIAGVGRRAGGLTPLALLVTAALAYLLFKIQYVIVLLLAGILLATAIAGPVEYLHRRARLPRGVAILLVYILILAGWAALGALLLPPVVREATRFVRDVPDLLDTLRAQIAASDNPALRAVADWLAGLASTAGADLSMPTGLALGVAQGVGGTFVAIFTVFMIAFYWVMEKARIKQAMAGLFRPRQRRRVLRLWGKVEDKLGAWLRGQLALMAVIGTAATIAYGAMGLPFWLILGVIAGLTEAIPNLGPALGAVPAVLVALTVDWRLALGVVVFVVVLQLTENAVLVPRIMRNAVGLSPLTTILAILAGGEFRGVAGALLAVPVAGALQVILADLLREKREREDAERGSVGAWERAGGEVA
ncbi:MAG TPA: AI-2E family transporter [Thermomicrobiales bacterium]|nr:AI-2E family transporter [Thermomicrobiales bacterium]